MSRLASSFLFLSLLLSSSVVLAQQAATSAAGQSDPMDAIIESISRQDYEGAIAALQALESSADLRVPATLGAVYVQMGRAQEALDALQPLLAAEQQDPGVLYNAGRAAVALGRPQDALRYLEASVALVPASPARRELGLLYGRLGDFAAAYPHLRAWVNIDPNDQEARLAAAVAAIQVERAPDAEALISDLDQEDPGVQMLWAQTMLLKADPYGALAYLEPLLENAPPALEPDVRRGLSRARLMIGESDKAIEVLEGHVSDDPRLALQLTQAYYQNGNVEAALATLQPYAEALLKSPNPERGGTLAAATALEYGRLLVTEGRAAPAVPHLRLAAELDPTESQVWQVLGQALAATGDSEGSKEAIARFQAILEAGPEASPNQAESDINDPTGRQLRLAMQRFAQGNTAGAMEILAQERQMSPQDPRPPLLASRILLQVGQAEQALGAAESALGIAVTADGLYQRGAVLMALERFGEAEASLRQALETDPDHGGTLNDLAVLLLHQERKDEARQLLEHALELRPDDEIAQANLARAQP